MKEIKLSQHGKNRGLYVALVDDDDFDYLNQFKWQVQANKYGLYAKRHMNGLTIRMHWDIMGGKLIDHIDGNGLNNQRNNLRFCTHSQNAMNKKSDKNTTSKYKGVCWYKTRSVWVGQIGINGKSTCLGYFTDEIEAAKAYDREAKILFGEFARLNL